LVHKGIVLKLQRRAIVTNLKEFFLEFCSYLAFVWEEYKITLGNHTKGLRYLFDQPHFNKLFCKLVNIFFVPFLSDTGGNNGYNYLLLYDFINNSVPLPYSPYTPKSAKLSNKGFPLLVRLFSKPVYMSSLISVIEGVEEQVAFTAMGWGMA